MTCADSLQGKSLPSCLDKYLKARMMKPFRKGTSLCKHKRHCYWMSSHSISLIKKPPFSPLPFLPMPPTAGEMLSCAVSWTTRFERLVTGSSTSEWSLDIRPLELNLNDRLRLSPKLDNINKIQHSHGQLIQTVALARNWEGRSEIKSKGESHKDAESSAYYNSIQH